jgi:hypothetical protein
MPTGLDIDNHRSLKRIATALEQIVRALEKLAAATKDEHEEEEVE